MKLQLSVKACEMAVTEDQSSSGESSTNINFDLNTALPDNANQDTGSLSQTPDDSSSSRNAVLTGDYPISRISDDVNPAEPELSFGPSPNDADRSVPTPGIPRQPVGNSSPRSSDSSRMGRQAGNSSGARQVDSNPVNNNSVPLNAHSQGFVPPTYHPGTYFYHERPHGYLYPSGMHLGGGQTPMQFNAPETMNAPLPYEFHHHQYLPPTWFNGFPMGPSPPNMPQTVFGPRPQGPAVGNFGSFSGPFASSDFHQWSAFPGAYQPNNLAANQQMASEYFSWLPSHQDGPSRHHPGGPGVPQTSQAMEVPTNTEDWMIPELNELMYGDEGNPSWRVQPETFFTRMYNLPQNSIQDRYQGLRYDIENMMYEELLALQALLGNVNVGLNEQTIIEHLKLRVYESDANDPSAEPERCCICIQDYVGGEEIGTLDCGHEYHSDCIKKWLVRKNECPICKQKGLAS